MSIVELHTFGLILVNEEKFDETDQYNRREDTDHVQDALWWWIVIEWRVQLIRQKEENNGKTVCCLRIGRK